MGAYVYHIFYAIISIHFISRGMYQVSENIARNFERFSGQETERFPETPVSENNLASAITLYIYFPRVTIGGGFCYPHPTVLI